MNLHFTLRRQGEISWWGRFASMIFHETVTHMIKNGIYPGALLHLLDTDLLLGHSNCQLASLLESDRYHKLSLASTIHRAIEKLIPII